MKYCGNCLNWLQFSNSRKNSFRRNYIRKYKNFIFHGNLLYSSWPKRKLSQKPSISTHSKPRMMPRIRLLKCFVLQTIKTKHMRSLIRRLVRGFEWLEILSLSGLLKRNVRWNSWQKDKWKGLVLYLIVSSATITKT